MHPVRFFLSLTVVLILAFGTAVRAEEPQMTAEQKAMMEAWTKHATPGEHHKHLAALAGTWKMHTKGWMDPSADPIESDGSCEFKEALGGRFITQSCTGTAMGMPFEGMGTVGYDNTLQKHIATWMDNMGTSIMMATGTCDKNGGLHMSGEYPDPVTGKSKKFRYTIMIADKNKHVMDWYEAGPDGKEMKTMEITYTR